MACNCVFLHQDILIVIFYTLNLHKKLMLNNFIILYKPFSKSVWYERQSRKSNCIKINFHILYDTKQKQHNKATFQLYLCCYNTAFHHSEPQVFRSNSPLSLSGTIVETYCKLYSVTCVMFKVGRANSFYLLSCNELSCRVTHLYMSLISLLQ
jgi:hypothetical protein